LTPLDLPGVRGVGRRQQGAIRLSALASHQIQSRPPRGPATRRHAVYDPETIASYLSDAAHVPGGHAERFAAPASEAEIADLVRTSGRVLPIGAQSSLTGGATPRGGTILSSRHFGTMVIEDGRVRAGAGVALSDLDAALATAGRAYPPVPTFMQATIGGIVSTNAAGATTFKYGSTRDWVCALTVVLATGDVLDIERGGTVAHPDGYFDLLLAHGPVRIDVPRYAMPAVQKLSAGYFARPGMDLIDLFIGSEGTLGVVTEATLRTLAERRPHCLAFVTFDDRGQALRCVRDLREAALATWTSGDVRGLDISGIEHMDGRSLALVREDGVDQRSGVSIPATATMALLVTIELPAGTTKDEAYEQIGRADRESPATPLAAFTRILERADALDRAVLAMPGEHSRARRLLEIREAVPAAVNHRVKLAQSTIDPRIEKTAADIIVPFGKIGALLDFLDRQFATHRLDAAVWGHISDGNLHPNVMPASVADLEAGRAVMLAAGREAIRLGGAPLAEHGVGRNPTKQQLLEELYGAHGIADMRAVKAALDPEGKLAPGNLFAIVQRG
jgi:D-lactate dehydrogenase (cytochrome)